MQNYTIGRSQNADIVTPKTETSVSNIHAKLQVDTKQRYLLINESRNGLFFKKKSKWIKFEKGYVTLDTPLSFGRFQTTLRHLFITSNNDNMSTPTQDSILYRNPATGEINRTTGK